MWFYVLLVPCLILITYSDIKLYFWNKKTLEEKHVAWCKAYADYNHKKGIVNELQYDYMDNFKSRE